jgi:hypothetical protein
MYNLETERGRHQLHDFFQGMSIVASLRGANEGKTKVMMGLGGLLAQLPRLHLLLDVSMVLAAVL